MSVQKKDFGKLSKIVSATTNLTEYLNKNLTDDGFEKLYSCIVFQQQKKEILIELFLATTQSSWPQFQSWFLQYVVEIFRTRCILPTFPFSFLFAIISYTAIRKRQPERFSTEITFFFNEKFQVTSIPCSMDTRYFTSPNFSVNSRFRFRFPVAKDFSFSKVCDINNE